MRTQSVRFTSYTGITATATRDQRLRDLQCGEYDEAMANELRVMLELGPKGKRVVAVAPDWPGLERGAKTGEAAIERLQS